MVKTKGGGRLGGLSLMLGAGAIAIALIGATLARYDVIGKLPGFGAVTVAVLLAVIGVIAGSGALLVGFVRKAPLHRSALAGLILSGAYLALIASYVVPASEYPAIHDATTDLADPPEFRTLSLREDNLVGVGTMENWRKIHAAAFPDLKTVRIAKPVSTVIADAERLASERGWTVASADPETGRLEATAYASYIRFRDDVVLTAKPAGDDPEASMVDMRSVSRVGGGDLGYNANRIRDFLSDLQAQ